MSYPAESRYTNSALSLTEPATTSAYSLNDTLRYLERINIPSTTDLTPSLALLDQLLLSHHLSIPYDSSSLHVKRQDWLGENKPIILGTGDGMELFDVRLGQGNFERIVDRRSGGFCYALNTAFATLLRSLKFRVSDVGGRVYLIRGKDPATVGYKWSPITHQILIVDWPGSEGKRYMMDAGFAGGGLTKALLIRDGEESNSLSETESFLLRKEQLIEDENVFHDRPEGFTLLRRVLPRGLTIHTAKPDQGYFTPCYHFSLQTTTVSDIKMLNHYNETHPDAPFISFFVVSQLQPSGGRKTLAYGNAPADLDGVEGRKAKLYQKEGILGEETNIEWIDFETGPMRRVLEKEFGFVFS